MEMANRFVELLKNLREKSLGEESMLINRNDSIGKLEDLFNLISSYLLRLPVDLNSFDWALTLKYSLNESNSNISIQVTSRCSFVSTDEDFPSFVQCLSRSMDYGYDLISTEEMFVPREEHFIGQLFVSMGSSQGNLIIDPNVRVLCFSSRRSREEDVPFLCREII